MSEWDFDGPEGTNLSSGPERNRRAGTGGSLNLPMTAVCLLAVAAVSFAVAWIMKDRVRDFAEMGLTCAAPFAALMVSSMLVEQATGRMTPQCSRKAQLVCMLVTVAVAFLVGCLAEVLHQPVILERTEPEYDYLLVLDKSGDSGRDCSRSTNLAGRPPCDLRLLPG